MRIGTYSRSTKETTISAALNLDGGAVEISTGIGFFDHMLEALAVHAGFGLTLKAEGDLRVDGHHTVEDTGIVLGKALAEALGDKGGIRRYGTFFVPMDESLAMASLDVGGRPFWFSTPVFRRSGLGYRFLPDRRVFPGAGVSCRHHLASQGAVWAEFPPYRRSALQGGRHALKEAVTPAEGILSTKAPWTDRPQTRIKGENP